MEHRSYTKILLQPSVFSSVTGIIAATVVLAAANWGSISKSLFFHDYLFGPDSIFSAHNADGSITNGIFNSPLTNNILILLGALVIGSIIFFLLQSRQYIAHGRDAWQLQEAARLRSERRQRMHIRLVVLAGWIVFSIFSAKLLFPFCILASEVGINALWTWQGIAYTLFGGGLFWVILHVHLIFARLFLLRLRVFGGSQTVLFH